MNYVLKEAHKLMKQFGTGEPHQLAEYLDIEVIKYPFSKLRGMFFTIKGQKFAAINNNLGISEQKFTLLHEIAHARLHPEINYFFIKENNLIVTGKYEHQAHLFAAVLLLRETPEEYRAQIARNLTKKIPSLYIKKLLNWEETKMHSPVVTEETNAFKKEVSIKMR
ncbi:MAG: ImmA/IrrE family metallo-endopeptidase [Thermoanaerobacteraceae bacterium]|nr:ImmA/IrrE family metallo-endopeptidase [Thermoanaerobacteraceae bacterium]